MYPPWRAYEPQAASIQRLSLMATYLSEDAATGDIGARSARHPDLPRQSRFSSSSRIIAHTCGGYIAGPLSPSGSIEMYCIAASLWKGRRLLDSEIELKFKACPDRLKRVRDAYRLGEISDDAFQVAEWPAKRSRGGAATAYAASRRGSSCQVILRPRRTPRSRSGDSTSSLCIAP